MIMKPCLLELRYDEEHADPELLGQQVKTSLLPQDRGHGSALVLMNYSKNVLSLFIMYLSMFVYKFIPRLTFFSLFIYSFFNLTFKLLI